MQKLILPALLILNSVCYAWEPTQASASKISLEYELFSPYGTSTVNLSVNDAGFIDKLEIYTRINSINIDLKELKSFRYPSLPDIEIMHYGEYSEESSLGGNFSLCVPYGAIKRVKSNGMEHWQRPVLVIFVTKERYKISNIPLPTEQMKYAGLNGCEIAAQEIFGF